MWEGDAEASAFDELRNSYADEDGDIPEHAVKETKHDHVWFQYPGPGSFDE